MYIMDIYVQKENIACFHTLKMDNKVIVLTKE